MTINNKISNLIKLLPVRNKYIAKNEVGSCLNIFVFESGAWTNVGVGFIALSELIELYSVVRSHELAEPKRIKKANPNPSIIKNNTTKNGKTSSATPIIIAKYFPYDGNARKNIKNLKVNNKIEIAIISWRGGFWLTIQYIDIIIGKEYAPTSTY